jgi:hypothetical protein
MAQLVRRAPRELKDLPEQLAAQVFKEPPVFKDLLVLKV